jgi:FtsZ-binding cell division protein ZapB
MAQPGNEAKREEFRKYLEKNGVLDALTKVLVGLYEEPDKPNDALEFVKKHLHSGAGGVDAEVLQREVEELRERVQALEEENAQLKEALEKSEGSV